jgi:secreted repeat protein with Y-X4-D motif
VLSLKRMFLGMSILLVALTVVACGSSTNTNTGSGGGTTPTSSAAFIKTSSVTVNGQQVEYNGHPLYNYSGDTAPGQTNGEGIGGMWFVATTTLSVQSAPQVTPTSSGYGY